ncbi:Fusaric acid resistance protein-like-domain-containing protein [Sporodiniella umbellata]|nr:Fusaric acid resistance protein-like-domain-containing protein [Sporodiniella umbellata]
MDENYVPKRRPYNALADPQPESTPSTLGIPILSTSPQSSMMNRTQSSEGFRDFDSIFDPSIASPSARSEIEVILDDGTTQKRTVSLSTLPDASIEYKEPSPTDQTPLLNSQQENYSALTLKSPSIPSSSSSEESDSDEPFFPVGHKKHHKSLYVAHKKETRPMARVWSSLRSRLELTPSQRLVLKCSFAYFLGSLFTFVPVLNGYIGNNRTSSHLVATATVFFNPAKSLGGMVEAATYGWGYVLFAVTVCLGSMFTTDYFIDNDMYLVAHSLSLFFWLAGSTFIVSFLKAHWNKPPVATASSLCFITIFIVVVREGSVNKGDFDTTRIEQITSAVATGTLITVACCILFWPSSAASKLKKDVNASLASYRVLLKLLTKTFLLDDNLPEFKANNTLQAAIQSHQASFSALQKSLKEAKLETFWNSEIRGKTEEYDQVVRSMQRLAQHMGGLRSSCGIQFEIMGSEAAQKYRQMARNNRMKNKRTLASENDIKWNVRAGYRRRKLQDEMRKQKSAPLEDLDTFLNKPSTSKTFTLNEFNKSAMLIDFIQTIRPPLKSLAYTCKQTIYHLQARFVTPDSKSRITRPSPSLSLLKNNLQKAITLFEKSQKHAIQKLSQKRLEHMKKTDPEKGEETVGVILGEDVFLVYFFVFNMTEFARELITLVEAVQNLNEAKKRNLSVASWLLMKLKRPFIKNTNHPKKHQVSKFIPNESNTFDTLHTPKPKTKWRKFFIRLWMVFSLFKMQKMRYAIKATIASILLAIPAFIEPTKDWFREYRMEWALITLMVVMTPTVGGTNLVAVYRIFSTVLGCYTAMIFYMLFPGNMYILPVLTWLFSIPNFWMILTNKHGKFGQFTLLAYNLVMLNKYNDRETNDVEVWRLANQRCFAILVGVLFGLIATAYIWPYEARVELRKGLSDFLLRLAWLYQKLISLYSDLPASASILDTEPSSSESQIVTRRAQEAGATQSFMDLELELQRTLIELQDLLAQTPNEPRLKGPFPIDTYRTMLLSCQNIVDRFLSMRSVMSKDEWHNQIHREFMAPVAHERREMTGNILLYFYLLASALRLKTPMPPYFPPAKKAWEQLLLHIKKSPVNQPKYLLEEENGYIFYYAYVTLMEDVIRELDKLGDNMTKLFGSLVPADQWDMLFDEERH